MLIINARPPLNPRKYTYFAQISPQKHLKKFIKQQLFFIFVKTAFFQIHNFYAKKLKFLLFLEKMHLSLQPLTYEHARDLYGIRTQKQLKHPHDPPRSRRGAVCILPVQPVALRPGA